MNMGFAWQPGYEAAYAERSESGRAAKLRAAIPATLSVFRALMRRQAGATVVVLVPRTERPSAPHDVMVIDERDRNAS
jgi:hypothetical protein